jgi:hypothetical protein
MKNSIFHKTILSFFLLCSASSICAADAKSRIELQNQYDLTCSQYSDIYEHVPVLQELASQCATVTELGLRGMNSTWGLLMGLANSSSPARSYLGIDIAPPVAHSLNLARRLAQSNDIDFQFIQGNDMHLDIQPTELLFIDTLHTYCHLTYELEKFSPFVSKYIVMHDTSEPWGEADDNEYRGNFEEYPPFYDHNKRGLWPAVVDFLDRHPEWVLQERRLNNHGLTTLRRISN